MTESIQTKFTIKVGYPEHWLSYHVPVNTVLQANKVFCKGKKQSFSKRDLVYPQEPCAQHHE